MAKGLGRPKMQVVTALIEQALAGFLNNAGEEQRGAGRIQGQRIKYPRRSKNGPAHQGEQECARRRQQMERTALKHAA
jgi:hypothetical protein